MVKELHQEPVTSVGDAAAVEIFRHQWQLYRKFLKHDYLSNAGAYAALHRFLLEDVARPFEFLDLACGDASGIVTVLKGHPVTHYCGVDLAPPALALARHNLEELACPVVLEEANFVTSVRVRQRPTDIVWISLSLHHLAKPDKQRLMRDVREGIGEDGALLVYEPTCFDGEDRSAYLDRFEAVARESWTELTAEEVDEALRHVRACDLPETVSDWVGMGRKAGFTRVVERYRSPDELFRLFSYQLQ